MTRKGQSIPAEVRFWAKVNKAGDCWEWTAAKDKDGYGLFTPDTQELRMWRSHRYSWTLANGPIPVGLHVLHRCDNPPCVRPDHLLLGTGADNTHDRDQKGRTSKGAHHYKCKLTPAAIDAIRERYDGGDGSYAPGRRGRAPGNADDLCAEFNISRSTLYRVLHGYNL